MRIVHKLGVGRKRGGAGRAGPGGIGRVSEGSGVFGRVKAVFPGIGGLILRAYEV